MESFFSRYKNALVLMLVLLAQVVLLAMQVRRPAPNMPDGHNVRLWRYWVASVVTPPERLAHGIGSGLRGVWSNYIYLRHLREQNESLQEENTRLRLEQAGLAEDAIEGQRLREMLDFRAQYIDKTLPAQVVGTAGTDQAHVIYIDKGSNDGVRAQMPVITPDGIVGKVKNVFPGTAQVLLISDQTSGAGVMLQTTRIRGVMKGNASGEPQIINISPDDRIKAGEPVLTSGGDQVYPRGLPVGEVERVVPDPETSYVNVIVKPYANLARLEEVMVITEVSDKMPFAVEKDVMQSEVDALAEKQRAADILSDRLPSIRDEDTPETKLAGADNAGADSTEGAATAGGGDPARPMRPPPALHPDRYTPGAAPPAESLTPGAAPAGLHRELGGDGSSVATAPKVPKTTAGAAGAGSTATDATANVAPSAPVNRFPPKPHAASPAADSDSTGAAKAVAAGGAAAGSAVPKTTSPGGATAVGAANARAVPRVPANSGSGLTLPLQAADSTVARTPRPAASGAVGGTAGAGSPAVSSSAGPVAKPATGVATGAAAGGGQAGTATAKRTTPSAATTSPSPATTSSRRISIPSSAGADGILTPAGMGLIGGTPRPKPAVPTTPSAGTQAAPAKQSTPAKPASQTPPGGR
jgi:rod shape-determining protein MreC